MRMLNVAGVGARRGLQECFDQFAASDVGMAMLARKFRYHGPGVISSGLESFAKNPNGSGVRWRTVDQGDHRSVTAAIENLMQADLQRTELAAVGVGIDDDRCAFRISYGRDGGFILARNHNDEVGGERKRTDGGREKRVFRWRLPFDGWGPGQEGFIRAHARGFARGGI